MPFSVSGQEYLPLAMLETKVLEYNIAKDPHQGEQVLRHRPVKTEGYKTKLCAYCQLHRTKTASGWRVSTRYKCELCNVPLCTQNRDCFHAYHRYLFQTQSGHN